MESCLASGNLLHKLTVPELVIAEKRLAILEHGTRGLLRVVEGIVALTQVVLQNTNLASQSGECLAVLRLVQAECTGQLLCLLYSLHIMHIDRRKPLAQQRNRLTGLKGCHVSLELLTEQCLRLSINRGVEQNKDVIPAAILCNVREIAQKRSRPGLCQILQEHTEYTTLTEAASDIAGIEENLHGEVPVLSESAQKALLDLRLILATKRTDGGKQVQTVGTGGPQGHGTVLGPSLICHVLQKLQHENHSFLICWIKMQPLQSTVRGI